MVEALPTVDVVIPCYNYGHYLAPCVASVLRQTGVEARVLILDDESPDKTPEIGAALAKAETRVTYRRHAKNRGHILTYNEGIEWVSGDYFLLLSADDYLLAGALQRATGLMQRHPEVGFTFGRAFLEREGEVPTRLDPMNGKATSDGQAILTGSQFIARTGARNIVPAPTAVVRSSLQKRVGGYRRELPHSGDMEMWLRLAACAPVGYLDADQAVYRQHATNMSRHYSTTMLPDLEQRQAALEHFFEASLPSLVDAESLRGKLQLDLACQAISAASRAFNKGDLELADQITHYAIGIDPGIVNTPSWWRLAVKRRIGKRAWTSIDRVRQALRPAPRNGA